MKKDKLEQMLTFTNDKITKIEKQLKNYPTGRIQCFNNGKYKKWYHLENGLRKYIPKSNINFARTLSYKQYLVSSLQNLYVDQKALMKALKCYNNYDSKEKEFIENENYAEILKHIETTSIEDLEAWSREEYPRNTFNPSGLKHQSISGNILRSKSEMIIDQLLFINGIPYRYECELMLGESIIYPDFTIRHPKTGEYFYWEHFGMIDSPAYSQKAFIKIQNYCKNGYFPSIKLITTFETSQCPIDAVKIENVISQYFQV